MRPRHLRPPLSCSSRRLRLASRPREGGWTHATIGQLMRTIGFSAAPGILAVLRPVPFVGPLIALFAVIWQFVAMVVAVRQALDYSSTWRAFLVCAIGWVIYICATLFLSRLFVLGILGSTVFGRR